MAPSTEPSLCASKVTVTGACVAFLDLAAWVDFAASVDLSVWAKRNVTAAMTTNSSSRLALITVSIAHPYTPSKKGDIYTACGLWYSTLMRRTLVVLALSSLLQAGVLGDRVLYVGGTVAGVPNHSNADIDVRDESTLFLHLHAKALSIAWSDVSNIEYGMRVD